MSNPFLDALSPNDMDGISVLEQDRDDAGPGLSKSDLELATRLRHLDGFFRRARANGYRVALAGFSTRGGCVKTIEGPDQYWSTEVPPSRGQWKDIARVALELLGIPEPESRLDATIAMVRLRAAVTEQSPGGVPEAW